MSIICFIQLETYTTRCRPLPSFELRASLLFCHVCYCAVLPEHTATAQARRCSSTIVYVIRMSKFWRLVVPCREVLIQKTIHCTAKQHASAWSLFILCVPGDGIAANASALLQRWHDVTDVVIVANMEICAYFTVKNYTPHCDCVSSGLWTAIAAMQLFPVR